MTLRCLHVHYDVKWAELILVKALVKDTFLSSAGAVFFLQTLFLKRFYT